jgi:hypothetical protein
LRLLAIVTDIAALLPPLPLGLLLVQLVLMLCGWC